MAASLADLELDETRSETPVVRPLVPRGRTRLVGREAELAQIAAWAADPAVRLLTLVGVGGAGKTRLALEAVALIGGAFADGVAFAALDGVSDSALVATVVAEALGIRDQDRRTDLDRVVAWLRSRQLLLVLDTLEHLPEAGRIASELLERCPGLRVLATSRIPLLVRVERRLPVAPLAVPEVSADAKAALAAPAVQLLLERIADGRSDFVLDDDSAPAIVDLVRRLDGLPLALELAAGRMRHAGVFIERLGDLVAVGASALALPKRQRNVRAVLEWSYGMLPPAAQWALRAVSVHVGPFDATVARALADGEVDLAPLIDHSLVQPAGDRFVLLALVREYAAAKLSESGEEAGVRRRWVARAVARAEEPASQRWVAELELEHENLRAVLDYLLAHQGGVTALRLAGALSQFWYLHGHYHEGRRWLRRALAETPQAPGRARALQGAGRLAFLQCDYLEARSLLEEAVAVGDGDQAARLAATQTLGSVAREQGDFRASLAHHEACLALATDPPERARSHAYIGFAAWLNGDLVRGRAALERAAADFAMLDDAEGTATSQIYLGGLAFSEGDLDSARVACARGLSISRRAGFLEGVAWARNLLGVCDLARGDLDRATAELRASLRIHLELGDVWRACSVLEALARVNAERSRYGRAARLFGAATQIRASIGTPVPPVERSALEELQQTLDAMLGSDLETELASGRYLELEDAARLACADDDDLPAPVWW